MLVPKILGHRLQAMEINENVEWEKGPFGVLEPRKALPYEGPIDIGLIPGLAFTLNGRRLGRGKGYFDRFLASYEIQFSVGVAFDFQIVPTLPRQAWDLPVDAIVTPSGLRYAEKHEGV